MPVKATKEGSDEEVDAFLPEEVETAKAEAVAAAMVTKDAEIAEAKKEVERLQRVSAEKTENFKKLNDMTEAEKAQMTSAQIEDRKRIEAAEAEVTRLREEKNSDTQNRVKFDTENALAKYHGGDQKLKEELEKNFKLIGLEGNDTATINERARLAANMYAGQTGRANPLTSPMHGSSPRAVEKSKTEEFMKSEKAKAALEMMGMGEKKA